MNNNEFKRIVATFADNPNEMEVSKGHVTIQIRDEIIDIEMKQRDMTLYVAENGDEYAAEKWIVNRLARLPQLADRLIDYTPVEEHFVVPRGCLLDQIENNPEEKLVELDDAASCVRKILDQRSDFLSNVIYLTSDAGEGKTTLISQIAREQAVAYKKKETDWLLIPILLGGRPFLRFDDIVIASFVNKYRFQMFFWETFIEMVKMGVLIPAFDGFEEMFVLESATDEAISSLGSLLNQFESSGSMLISARKAYFDYKSFSFQAKLFDTIRSNSVSFSKLSLNRWGKEQFLLYSEKRNVANGNEIYAEIAQKLGEDHPVLTRAVLVKRVLDVAETVDYADFSKKIGHAPDDYFPNFVDAIIEREIKTKWTDRSGVPLLNLDEHHQLLSMIAQEMWQTNTESLKTDLLDLIAELFSELHRKNSRISHQIKERIKQHALLIRSGRSKAFSFDHDEFRQFFLGKALAENMMNDELTEVRSILRISSVSQQTADTAASLLKQKADDISHAIRMLQGLCIKEGPVSFIRENCGLLTIRLLDGFDTDDTTLIENMAFPPDALHSRKIRHVSFRKSYFRATGLRESRLTDCRFISCIIERFAVDGEFSLNNVTVRDSTIESVLIGENEIFDPNDINVTLANKGFVFTDNEDKNIAGHEPYKPDPDLILTEKVLGKFIRATQIGENIFKAGLGSDKKHFFSNILPTLLHTGILADAPYPGEGKQRRFRLGVPMNQVNTALANSEGRFDLFVRYFETQCC